MQNHNDEQNQAYDYRGKRGLVLLRVSTKEQERKYGFPSQLRSIREKLRNELRWAYKCHEPWLGKPGLANGLAHSQVPIFPVYMSRLSPIAGYVIREC